MLDFENLDGFVIDLTTKKLCDEILEDILSGDNALYNFVILYPLQYKREFILDYFTDTYKYVFCKSAYVYQICESELCEDNEIDGLKVVNKALTLMLDDEQERNSKLRVENAKLRYTLKRIAEETTQLLDME